MYRRLLLGLLLSGVVGCAKTATSTTASGGTSSSSSGSSAKEAPDKACQPAALGLGAARAVAVWTTPTNCTLTPPNPGTPTPIHTEAAFAEWFKCAADVHSKLDFANQTLVVVSRTLSPAGVGTDVYDDGKTVTFVSKARQNCPNDPMPMPMSYALSFVVPGSAEREFKEATCTIASKCP